VGAQVANKHTKKAHIRNKKTAGLTLLELIVAMAILVLASLPILSMLLASVQSNAQSHRITMASIIAQQAMEEFVGRPWDCVANCPAASPTCAALEHVNWGHRTNISGFVVVATARQTTYNADGGATGHVVHHQRPVGTSLASSFDVGQFRVELPASLVEISISVYPSSGDSINLVAPLYIHGRNRLAMHTSIMNVEPGGIAR